MRPPSPPPAEALLPSHLRVKTSLHRGVLFCSLSQASGFHNSSPRVFVKIETSVFQRMTFWNPWPSVQSWEFTFSFLCIMFTGKISGGKENSARGEWVEGKEPAAWPCSLAAGIRDQMLAEQVNSFLPHTGSWVEIGSHLLPSAPSTLSSLLSAWTFGDM